MKKNNGIRVDSLGEYEGGAYRKLFNRFYTKKLIKYQQCKKMKGYLKRTLRSLRDAIIFNNLQKNISP